MGMNDKLKKNTERREKRWRMSVCEREWETEKEKQSKNEKKQEGEKQKRLLLRVYTCFVVCFSHVVVCHEVVQMTLDVATKRRLTSFFVFFFFCSFFSLSLALVSPYEPARTMANILINPISTAQSSLSKQRVFVILQQHHCLILRSQLWL